MHAYHIGAPVLVVEARKRSRIGRRATIVSETEKSVGLALDSISPGVNNSVPAQCIVVLKCSIKLAIMLPEQGFCLLFGSS